MENVVQIILSIIIVLVSLTFHEAAHALAAFMLGDSTARDRGRMTLNPIAHIDPLGTVILPLLLAISGAGVFGWAKPVPVNIYNLKNPRRDDGIISAAGPAANLVLALLSALLIRGVLIATSGADISSGLMYIVYILRISIVINIFLMLFNLLPIPPLDGFGILGAILPVEHAYKLHKLHRYGFLILMILVFTNLLGKVYLGPVGGVMITLFYKIAGFAL